VPSAKPIDELSADDLHAHPIWEYAMDEEEEHDETYVRPVTASSVPRELHVVYHAACEVVAATGKSYTAFMSICNGALHTEAPVVVGNAGEYWPLDLPHDYQPAKFKQLFGVTRSALFPMRWRLRVPVAGESEPRSGVYAGG
jgi:hypothetical protein